MSSRIWPDSLPEPIGPGYEFDPVDQTVRTDMEVGTSRVRRISAARGDDIRLAWKMTDQEMAAFRAWHADEPWSLAGASDDATGWTGGNASVSADAVVGPALQLADTIVEDGATGEHRIGLALAEVADGDEVVLCATLKAAGRSAARLTVVGRDGVLRSGDVDLTTGVASGASGLTSYSTGARGDGWWRGTIRAPVGTGASAPEIRIGLKDGGGNISYAGDGASGVSVCEINARVATGYDLYLPTEASGAALGAAGGSAWFGTSLAFGGGFRSVEARFKGGGYRPVVLPGLNWLVSAEVEVRYA